MKMNPFFNYVIGLSEEPSTVVNKYLGALDSHFDAESIDFWYERRPIEGTDTVEYVLKCSANTQKDQNGNYVITPNEYGKPQIEGINLITEPELLWSGRLHPSDNNPYAERLSELLLFDPIIRRDSPPQEISNSLFYQAIRRAKLLEDIKTNYPRLNFKVTNIGLLTEFPESKKLGMKHSHDGISAPHGLLRRTLNPEPLKIKKAIA